MASFRVRRFCHQGKGLIMKKTKKYWGNYLLFVGPVFFSFLLFYFVPILLGLRYSFYDWNGISNSRTFIGIKNYVQLLSDRNYWDSIHFTVKYAFFYVILTNAFAILMALWANSALKSSIWIRICFFLPNVLSQVICGMLWKFIFNQAGGKLSEITHIDIFGIKLLASSSTAWIAVLIVSLWTGIGYNMIIYLAGLVSIDKTYFESAAIDGAGKIRTFFSITLPLMMPSITITLFNTISSAFKMFDVSLSLTGGGPGRSTQSMALDVYSTAFEENRMGYGQAKAVVLLVVVVILALIQVNVTRRKEVEM